MTHPTTNEFHPVHHPSYIDFFEQVLPETTDPLEIEQRYEQSYATDEWYRHLYRTSHAYHGVHPFYMWYWGSHALEHLGGVIVVGGDPATVRRLGFRPASTLADALEMATDVVGPSPTRHLREEPAARHGGRDVSTAPSWSAVQHRSSLVTSDAPGDVSMSRVRRSRVARCARSVSRTPSAATPRGVEPPPTVETLGDAYDTEWARSPVRSLDAAGGAGHASAER